jgi:thiol-disulfide isomerase/thioredoxin
MATEAAKGRRTRFALWAGLVLAAGVAALIYGLFAVSSKPAAAGYARYARGAMAALEASPRAPAQPAQVFQDAEGRARRLSDFRGEVLLVNVWATWCAPCVRELPTLAALQRRFAGRGLKVAAISVDSEAKRADAEAMLAERGGGALDFFIDPTRAMAFAIGAPGLPTTILYDRRGVELARLSGGADWASPEAAALMEAALSGAPPAE